MPKKILVIEDQVQIIKLLTGRLKASGYNVVSALDGLEGLEKVKKELPDLVITDLALPKMVGSTIVRIMRGSEQYKHIPIIMLSAFVHENMAQGVEVPADAYIPKPFEAEKLLAKIRELLKEV